MAEPKSPSGGADFVGKIVKDPKNPPETLMFKGFLGASSEEGHARIYFDPQLATYAEIPNDAILHTVDAPAVDGLVVTTIWIKRDAVLIYGPAGSARPKGTFLEGVIMQNYMAGAAQAPQAFFPSLFQRCPSGHPSCGEHTLSAPQAYAPSLFQRCQSGHPSCGEHTLSAPQAFAIPTITFQGYVCPSYYCGGGGHTLAMAAIPTITFQGQVCHTHLAAGCGGGGPHTM